jgi:hypothetical protein
MSRYTNGPWIAKGNLVRTDELDGSYHREICQVGILWTYSNQAEAEANARLIASAPELLDAIKGLLAVWKGDFLADGGAPDVLDRIEYMSSIPELGNAIRAIRKAEGKDE